MKETDILKEKDRIVYDEYLDESDLKDGFITAIQVGYGKPYLIVTKDEVNEQSDLQPLVDALIDKLEGEKDDRLQETVGEYEDEFLYGGNHCLYLKTDGIADIRPLGRLREISPKEVGIEVKEDEIEH